MVCGTTTTMPFDDIWSSSITLSFVFSKLSSSGFEIGRWPSPVPWNKSASKPESMAPWTRSGCRCGSEMNCAILILSSNNLGDIASTLASCASGVKSMLAPSLPIFTYPIGSWFMALNASLLDE